MKLPPVVKIDKVIIDAPLGLRFWDSATRRTIGEGLIVTIEPALNARLRMQASPNRSGIYVFHRLPVLGELPIPEGDGPFWSASAPDAGYIVQVEDERERFLPFRFQVMELRRGVFELPCAEPSPLGSPLSSPPEGIPLFSAPARTVPTGMAVVRADLRRSSETDSRGIKAAWAVLSAFHRGRMVGRGLADKDGKALIVFAYPKPVTSSSPSGVLGAVVPLHRQVWSLDLEVSYLPADPPDDFPDLCTVLSAAQGSLLGSLAPDLPLGPVELNFGQETVVKTADKSELFFAFP